MTNLILGFSDFLFAIFGSFLERYELFAGVMALYRVLLFEFPLAPLAGAGAVLEHFLKHRASSSCGRWARSTGGNTPAPNSFSRIGTTLGSCRF